MITVPGYFDRRQLAHEPIQELHNGGWAPYAEKSSRAEIIASGFAELRPAMDFGLEPLLNVHDQGYVHFLRTAYGEWRASGRDGDAIGYTWPVARRRALNFDRIDAKLGLYSYDAATPIAEGTWEASYWSAQTALTALGAILNEEARTGFALCRPPGHHAGRDYCGGYCYLNNAAIAAEHARRSGRRVAILDIDYHHGNGTQDIFYGDAEVLFVSIHADPTTDYPFFWGHADETGEGEGVGKTLNLPLPRGTDINRYGKALEEALEAVGAHQPDLLVLSFGADTFEEDPISHFQLRKDDYRTIAQRITATGLPVLVVMEGGYAIDALGDNVESLLSGFEQAGIDPGVGNGECAIR
ncbi:MAG TPA: histone deacetylase family protein [Sphingomicrobium sp.]|nr:histone deacetylase family protein [Sphingomicrobium sp.]